MYGKWEPVDRGQLARTPGECIVPRLWRGCTALWAPCLGPSGNNLKEWTAGGNRANGTLTNMTGDDWVPSPLGWALDFDGSNDYIDLPAICDTSRLAPANAITIFAVINITGSVSVREYITNAGGGGAPAGFGFGISDAVANQTKWYTGTGAAGHNLQGGTTMTAGVWYSVAATFFYAGAGTNKYTYLDGKVDQSGATAINIGYTSTSSAIARYDNAASQYFPGKIALMGVWNYAMQARQIMQLHTDPVQMFRRRRTSLAKSAGSTTYRTRKQRITFQTDPTPWHVW